MFNLIKRVIKAYEDDFGKPFESHRKRKSIMDFKFMKNNKILNIRDIGHDKQRTIGSYEIIMENNDDIFNNELKFMEDGKVIQVKNVIKDKELIGKYFYEAPDWREYFYLFWDKKESFYKLSLVISLEWYGFRTMKFYENDDLTIEFFGEIDVVKEINELWAKKLYNLSEKLSNKFVK